MIVNALLSVVDDAKVDEGAADPMTIKELEAVDDIDALDHQDPRFCTEYVDDIFQYLREMEVRRLVARRRRARVHATLAPPTARGATSRRRPAHAQEENRCSFKYMTEQPDIGEAARTVLFEWMIEVNIKLHAMTDTIFLACNVADRFFSKRSVTRRRLQLVGTSAMLIALKYEEDHQLEIRDLVYMTNRACKHEDIVKMERIMLDSLSFNLGFPTPIQFLRRFSRAAHSDLFMHTLNKYLMELTIPEYNMLKYLPSEIAAAAVFIARD